MQIKETTKQFLRFRRRQILLTLLFFLPLVFILFQISLPQQFVFLNTYIMSGGYLIIPALLTSVFVFRIPFASPTNHPEWYLKMSFAVSILVTPVFWYLVASAIIASWDKFRSNFSGKTQFRLIATLVILLSPFMYKEIVRPAIVSSSFSIKMNTSSEISISHGYKEFHDENGIFRKYVLREFVLKNGSMLDTVYEIPRQAPVMCLYDTQSGAITRYGGYYADERGHGFVDPPTWNKIIFAPKSETKYYLLGDMISSDNFDEIVIPEKTVWSANKGCSDLTRADIEAGIANGAEVIKILK